MMNEFNKLINNNKKIYLYLGIMFIALLTFLIFGFKGNGDVSYYGQYYEAGSVFSPSSYTSYGISELAENELNNLVSEKRKPSRNVVIISVVVIVASCCLLYREDEIKEILIALRE